MLLQKRDSKPKSHPNAWAVVGGRMKEEEIPREAACRELEEELGISIEPSSLAFQGSIRVFREPGRQPLVHYYSTSFFGSLGDLKLAEWDGFALFNDEEIHSLRLRPEDRKTLERHYQNLGFDWVEEGTE